MLFDMDFPTLDQIGWFHKITYIPYSEDVMDGIDIHIR